MMSKWTHTIETTPPPSWTVAITRNDGEMPSHVAFTVPDGPDGGQPSFGDPTDWALAAAIGCALKAVSPTDESPWRLAVVCNLLAWLDAFSGGPEMKRLVDAAREVWDSLSEEPKAAAEAAERNEQ
jgi:hypothetical protein